MDPRYIVTNTAFRVSPDLLGADLATPWLRLAAILIDLLIASIIWKVGGPLFAAAVVAVFTFQRMTRPKRGPAGCFRSIGAANTALVALFITYGIMSDDDDDDSAPIRVVVDTEGSSTVAAERAVALGGAFRNVATSIGKTGTATNTEPFVTALEDFAASLESLQPDQALQRQVRRLEEENRELREQIQNPSLVRPVAGAAADLGLTLGWLGFYFTFFVAVWNGRTPGKRMLGLRIYRLDGHPISLWIALERFGGYAAGFATGLLGFAQIFWDANRQAIHDRIASTVVVRMAGPDLPAREWMTRAEAVASSSGSMPAYLVEAISNPSLPATSPSGPHPPTESEPHRVPYGPQEADSPDDNDPPSGQGN